MTTSSSMFRRSALAVAVAALSGSLAAAPSVQDVSVSYNAANGLVTVGYKLTGGPGIVTIDMLTNTLADASGAWVSVGDAHLTKFVGAVNRLVGETRLGITRPIGIRARTASGPAAPCDSVRRSRPGARRILRTTWLSTSR